MRLFADTSYWIAALNPNDPYRERAAAVAGFVAGGQIVTSDMVLTELASAFCGTAYKRGLVVRAIALMEPDERVTIVPQTRALFRAALQRFAERPDKTYSLVDCASMLIMEQEHLQDVLTTDQHFEQAGFRLAM